MNQIGAGLEEVTFSGNPGHLQLESPIGEGIRGNQEDRRHGGKGIKLAARDNGLGGGRAAPERGRLMVLTDNSCASY
jgi:hypothetical protein